MPTIGAFVMQTVWPAEPSEVPVTVTPEPVSWIASQYATENPALSDSPVQVSVTPDWTDGTTS